MSATASGGFPQRRTPEWQRSNKRRFSAERCITRRLSSASERPTLSLQPQTRLPDHIRPTYRFLLHEGGEFLGRIADRLSTFGFQPGQNLRAVDHLDRRFTELRYDFRRGALRHREAVPCRGLVSRPAAFRDGWQVGKPLGALSASHRERPQLPAIDEADDGRDGRNHEIE